MPPARFIRLTQEQDARLREIEQDPHLKPKASRRQAEGKPKASRRQAEVLRLSNRGERVEQIAVYTGRSPTSVLRDFDRWKERGSEGLADGTAPGNPPRVTGEVKAFMEEKLAEERTWNAPSS